MKLLVNLRGTSGAGKTFIVRKFMDTYGVEHLDKKGVKKLGEKINPDYYPGAARVTIPGWNYPIYFIGNYRPECGGLDTVPSQELCARWSLFHLMDGHVICEGLLTSGLGPGGIFCKTVMAQAPTQTRFLFLDTPMEKCTERIYQRRRGRGDTRPLKDDDHAGKKHRQIQNVIRTMQSLNYPVHMLDHERGFEDMFAMMELADNERREESS